MLEEVHVARKSHVCRGCSQTIRSGDPYTQRSLAPGEHPNRTTEWEVRRYCSACVTIATDALDIAAPCTFQVGETRCGLPAGHPTDHDLGLELF